MLVIISALLGHSMPLTGFGYASRITPGYAHGLKIGGGTQIHLRNLAIRLNADTSHFTGMGWNIGLRFQRNPPKPLTEILVKDRLYSNTDHIRKRLI